MPTTTTSKATSEKNKGKLALIYGLPGAKLCRLDNMSQESLLYSLSKCEEGAAAAAVSPPKGPRAVTLHPFICRHSRKEEPYSRLRFCSKNRLYSTCEPCLRRRTPPDGSLAERERVVLVLSQEGGTEYLSRKKRRDYCCISRDRERATPRTPPNTKRPNSKYQNYKQEG